MKAKALIFFLFLFVQCTVPKASITGIDNQYLIAPASILLLSESKNADYCIWKINDKVVSEGESLKYTFFSSGKYVITLEAYKGDKMHLTQNVLYVEASQTCRFLLRTTLGNMVFELSENTPNHLANFVQLAEKSYYDDLSFHRVIKGFIIQTGNDITRTKTKQTTISEQVAHEINTDLLHYKGALAAARMPDDINPDKASSGTQFYIVHGRNVSKEELVTFSEERLTPYSNEQIDKYLINGGAPQLDFEYTVFGNLIDGFDTLDKIASVTTGQGDKPEKDIRILELRIIN